MIPPLEGATTSGGRDDPGVQAAADQAIAMVNDGARIGLGAGRAVGVFIARLGARLGAGLRISAVAASRESEEQAKLAGIPLSELESAMPLDCAFDGADEVAPNLDLIKGWGGALVRERIIAAASRRQVIIVGSSKLVQRLGERGRLPIEVIPFARGAVLERARSLGLRPVVRQDEAAQRPFHSENGNLILDCGLPDGPIDAPAARELERALLAIPGVVDTGLFLGTAERVLVGYPDGRVDTLLRTPS